MSTIDRHQLHFGPYRTPEFQYGGTASCLVHGDVIITGISNGRIAWPMTTRQGGRSLVLYEDLAHAVEREAACAVAYWFGVSTWMVRKWRRTLGVPGRNQGDRLLKQLYAEGNSGELARQAALLTSDDPDRRAKISAGQRGRTRPQHVIESIRTAMTGRKLTPEHRAKVIPYLRRRGTQPVATMAGLVEVANGTPPEFMQTPSIQESFGGLYVPFADSAVTDGFSSA